jgi:hypothetical protein
MIHCHPKTQFLTIFAHMTTFTFILLLLFFKKKKKKKKTLKLVRKPPCQELCLKMTKNYIYFKNIQRFRNTQLSIWSNDSLPPKYEK